MFDLSNLSTPKKIKEQIGVLSDTKKKKLKMLSIW